MLGGESIVSGFLVGISLILAVGPQAIFVFRQGIIGENILLICGLCVSFDVMLITFGSLWFATAADALPGLEKFLRIGGSTFLALYALQRFRAARSGAGAVSAKAVAEVSPGMTPATDGVHAVSRVAPVVLSLIAITFLNPHTILDTVVLLGSQTANAVHPLAFGVGAIIASVVFFFTVGFGATFLRPLFVRARTWQMLDVAIGCLMLILSINLMRATIATSGF